MRVGIVGLGYVGLPLLVAFGREGLEVTGFDVSEDVVDSLTRGASHVEDIADADLAAVADLASYTTASAALGDCDSIVICVPTPLTGNREPDLGPLEASAKTIAGVLKAGQMVVLESTTYPGTTRECLVPILEESGLKAGTDFAVAYSPERVDPGRTDHTLRTTPKVVGGLTDGCRQRAVDLYSKVCDEVLPVSSTEAAELTKLLENIFRSVNIALVNELAVLADRMDIDIWEVVDAAATKPYGFMGFEPGPGMGGHCLPVDPFYLAWRARQFDMSTEFIELAGKVNQQMPYYCVERVTRALNRLGKSLNGSNVLLVGVAYKAGVGDMREAPALKIARMLSDGGANVSFHDQHVPEIPSLNLESVELDAGLAACDLAVIVTAHPGVDHDQVVAAAPWTLDLRGVTGPDGDSSERL
jgi:UDP-N-acetyl-D-glucosamine dehydrogenase